VTRRLVLAALILIAAPDAWAARTQFASSTATGAADCVVTISAPADGSAVVAVGGTATNVQTANEIDAVTMTGGTFIENVQTNNTTSPARNAEIWSVANVSGAGTTVTFDFQGSANTICAVLVYTGMVTSSLFDVGAAVEGQFDMSNGTGTTAATQAGDEVWVGAIILEGNTITSSAETPTGPPATSEAGEVAHGTAGKLIVWERIFDGSDTETASISATLSASNDHHALIGVFKAAASAAIPPPRRMVVIE